MERSDDTPPEVDGLRTGYAVPAERYPLTPLECWFVMRGYAVKPRTPVSVDDLLNWMPGHLEMVDGYILLRKG